MTCSKYRVSSADDVRRTLNNKYLLARIKPARLFSKRASEARHAIEVSCIASPQFEKRSDIVFQAMLVIQVVCLNRQPRL